MEKKGTDWGYQGSYILADCAVIIEPDANQLADIVLAAADSCRSFLLTEPKIAMLSFSSKGSASHETVDKVTQALAIVKEKAPDLKVDGELQLDAAIIPEVAARKAPGSPVAGSPNTLIFPNINAGNIGYKLMQRFGGFEAYGPIFQGFAKPVSDLSRGCNTTDIVYTALGTSAAFKYIGYLLKPAGRILTSHGCKDIVASRLHRKVEVGTDPGLRDEECKVIKGLHA